MIEDDMIEKVYKTLTYLPMTSREIAERIGIEWKRCAFILGILRRQGRSQYKVCGSKSHYGTVGLWTRRRTGE